MWPVPDPGYRLQCACACPASVLYLSGICLVSASDAQDGVGGGAKPTPGGPTKVGSAWDPVCCPQGMAYGLCLTHTFCPRGACQQAGTANGYCKRGDGIRPASRRRPNVDASRQRRRQRRRRAGGDARAGRGGGGVGDGVDTACGCRDRGAVWSGDHTSGSVVR